MMSFCKIILSGFKVVAVVLCAALRSVGVFDGFKNAVLLLAFSLVLFRGGAEVDVPPAPVELSPAELYRRELLIGTIPRVEILGPGGARELNPQRIYELDGSVKESSLYIIPICELDGKMCFHINIEGCNFRIIEGETVHKSNRYYDPDSGRYEFSMDTGGGSDPRCLRLFFGKDEPVPQFNEFPGGILNLTLIGAIKK